MEFLCWISTGCVLTILMLFLSPQAYRLLKRFFLRPFDRFQKINIQEIDKERFDYVHTYLVHKCFPFQPNNPNTLAFVMHSNQEIQDTFDGMPVAWSLRTTKKTYKIFGCFNRCRKIRSFELTFHSNYLTKVHSRYLPHVMEEAASIRRRNMNRRERSLTGGLVHVIATLAIQLIGSC